MGGLFADEEMRAEDGDLFHGIEQKPPCFGKPRSERRVMEAGTSTELAALEALEMIGAQPDLPETVREP